MKRMRILVVEDDPVVADDICAYLHGAGHKVLGPAYHLAEAKELAELHAFDIALLDIHLERHGEGIQLAQFIRGFSPAPIIFLTASADQFTLDAAKQVHPEHYLLKPFNSAQIKAALDIVMHNFISPNIEQQNLQRVLKFNEKLHEPFSKREIDLVLLLLEGCSNEEIAQKLFLSLHTVKSHFKRIFQKTNVESRTQLMSVLQNS